MISGHHCSNPLISKKLGKKLSTRKRKIVQDDKVPPNVNMVAVSRLCLLDGRPHNDAQTLTIYHDVTRQDELFFTDSGDGSSDKEESTLPLILNASKSHGDLLSLRNAVGNGSYLHERYTFLLQFLNNRLQSVTRIFILKPSEFDFVTSEPIIRPGTLLHLVIHAMDNLPERPEELKARSEKRFGEMGKQVPGEAVNEMLGTFSNWSKVPKHHTHTLFALTIPVFSSLVAIHVTLLDINVVSTTLDNRSHPTPANPASALRLLRRTASPATAGTTRFSFSGCISSISQSIGLLFLLKFRLFSNVAEMINNSNLKRYCSKMPSLQTALPPELANNAIRLYRECLRRAKYVGHKQHNTELVVQMVRQQFKKHMHETDPDKIQKLKDDAARGLINHILYEAEEMTGRKFS
ncbi:hypothetical protein L2E82_49082 [Cichorium intybus]|uniref:Uncharacterized protein n=1 Tax=Cichorium intybus TaxID=13427 RepID=A0ACB8Z0R8_CICIN|nr:hypothetical protein L2E82_49082 [Cichorium intybus]